MALSLWGSKSKQLARSLAMRRRPLTWYKRRRLNRATSALSMPGGEARCVFEGIRSGLYGRDTQHTFVERDGATVSRIVDLVTPVPRVRNATIHHGELHGYRPTRCFDFVYLDICSTFGKASASWIYKHLRERLLPGASLVVTVARAWRNNHYMHDVAAALKYGEFFRDYLVTTQLLAGCKYVGNTNPSLFVDDDDLDKSHWSTVLPVRSDSRWLQRSRVSPVVHEVSVFSLMALQLLLSGLSYSLDFLIEYRQSDDDPTLARSADMVTIGLRDFGLGPPISFSQSLTRAALANLG